ncbi:MAG: tyrosine-type recombinase/integrase [Alphaproteobacteria bacterium]
MGLTNRCQFLFQKRGVFYFSRRVPRDLRSHYTNRRIVLSLRTRSQRAAQTRSASLAAKLEEDWLTLRWKTSDDTLRRFLRNNTAAPAVFDSTAPLLTEAKELYVRVKGAGRAATFGQAAERCVRYLVEVCQDKPIDTYSRREVNAFRDTLFQRGLSRASVERILTSLRAIVNFTAKEQGLSEVRSFSGLYLGEDVHNRSPRRSPVPIGVVRAIQVQCKTLDDEARWLVALVSDTGMRLSEAVGLVKSDVVLDGDIPHIVLKPHPWRRLKTKGSERLVPLVGSSLWAIRRALLHAQSEFLFPKYCSKAQCKANSASAALNKWLGPRVPTGCVVHSFRHSFRDRLRAVECPSDVTDRLGGWKVVGIGEGYGEGYPLAVLHRWMKKIE